MKTKISLAVTLLMLSTLWGCAPKDQFKVGNTYNGFKLAEKRFVVEANAECYYFIHEKSGAHLFKIAADDANKLFNIAFKTAPENDCGTPHIMEHSVLNGSEKFPVKSPFDVLMKGSLNTFLNAMTGSDITTYPVASMNNKDYFNLMNVYLDAVFHPMIYKDPRILKQEGWHYELTDKNSPVDYKGVVYNEMKGAFSDPRTELSYQVNKILFPDNTYGKESGGYPAAIPELTYEDFIRFHEKFYHPSNSYILLYGNADLNQELAFIDSEYLSKYDKSEQKVEIPLQAPFSEMKEVEEVYPAAEGSPAENNTYLSLNFVAGKSTDRALCMAFDVLTDALVNHESGPVRLALQEAGIGQDVRANFSEMQQNVVEIQVQNANPGDKDKFKEIVFNTLKKVVAEGLDKKMIEGILNRIEFNLREGNSPQKGLMYLFTNYQGWFFADDPFLGLEFEKPLAEVKTALTTNYLESLIQEYMISNPHTLLMVMKPQPGLQNQINAQTTKELDDYKKALDKDGIENLVKETNELLEYQKREDAPEALATIPMLGLSDISKEIEWYNFDEKKLAGVPVIHCPEFTSNIIYTNLYFDLRVLPQELIPYASLLTSLLGKLDTEEHTFGELDNELNIHTGGFRTSTNTFLENKSDENLIPEFVVSSKSMADKAEKMYGLAGEILMKTKFNDAERLKSVLVRHQSRLDANIKQSGLNYALTRMSSYYSNQGMFDEIVRGLDYYRFVTDLVSNFGRDSATIIENLEKTASLLFTKGNLIEGITCSNDNYSAVSGSFEAFANSLSQEKPALNNWKFDFSKKNEALSSASKVQYVAKGYDYKKLGYEWNGKIRVLSQILSTDWLQNQVRVIGGAYGGFCDFSPSGNTYFASYRDPNLKETLDNFDATTGFLDKFEADDKEMTRFIIGTIAGMDQPMTASQKGVTAYQRYFERETPEQLKAEREAVLATTPEDIRNMKKMVEDVLAQDAICVYGNEDKIKQNSNLFSKVVNIAE